ncbi:e3 ubiquitin-protein ligase SHPRH-like isoform 2 [Planoprotostelium fungivorum]|uniref:E3 ubiquitin-protein ligase SHPRH-like isoform 2 n=1 Tax=Planoprotostelium fungivorum TaxID=1890364 RepID=A0A2P6NLT9_9EUKA|nr:e3 ubiquitin-protein ligase SHPRH-like isoform 2 [Planoprotostelium fungivorum]
MGRRKATAPQRLSSEEREEAAWSMGQVNIVTQHQSGVVLEIQRQHEPVLNPHDDRSRMSKRRRELEEGIDEALGGFLPGLREAMNHSTNLPDRGQGGRLIIVDDDEVDEPEPLTAPSKSVTPKRRKILPKPIEVTMGPPKKTGGQKPKLMLGTYECKGLDVDLSKIEAQDITVTICGSSENEQMLQIQLVSNEGVASTTIEENYKEFCSSTLQLAKKEMLWITTTIRSDTEATLFFWLTSELFSESEDSEDQRGQRHHHWVKTLVEFFHPYTRDHLEAPESIHNGKDEEDLEEFNVEPHKLYEALLPPADSPAMPQHVDILPVLRTYQLRAARWMVERESCRLKNPFQSHPLWIPLSCGNSSERVLYNPYVGRICDRIFETPPDVSGGILADEMGLGKTLEVLQCILSHPNPDVVRDALPPPLTAEQIEAIETERCECEDPDDHFEEQQVQCGSCGVWQHSECVHYNSSTNVSHYCKTCIDSSWKKTETPNGTTLIIVPSQILSQWRDEIQLHVRSGALRVLVYSGVTKRLILAEQLARYDVILTSYDVLRGEINHLEEGNRVLRNKKKYRTIGTPMIQNKWYRVVLDECQMVESSSAKASEMAARVPAKIRWCVSGTPIQKGVENLHGLIHFLHLSPLSERFWWNKVIQQPLERKSRKARDLLMVLCRSIMWRNSKKNVEAEIGIPPQTERVQTLRLSDVEKYFYGKQMEDCRADFEKKMGKTKEEWRSAHEYSKAMAPLLRLRQACDHYRVGSNSIDTMQKNAYTIDELLATLIQRAKIECEDQLRLLVSSLNGLAAIHVIKGENEEALKMYSQVIKMDKSDATRIDPLQKFHVYYNTADVMSQLKKEEIQITPEEKMTITEITTIADECKSKYIRNAGTNKMVHERAYHDIMTEMERHLKDHHLYMRKGEGMKRKGGKLWYQIALGLIASEPTYEKTLMTRISDGIEELLNSAKVAGSKAKSKFLGLFHEISGLSILLNHQWRELIDSRHDMSDAVRELLRDPTEEDIQLFSNCQQCRKRGGTSCNHCLAESKVRSLERKLFWEMKEDSVDSDKGDGTISRFDSELETVLKLILQTFNDAVRGRERRGRILAEEDVIAEIRENARVEYADMFDTLKKEFRAGKLLWQAEKSLVAAHDEAKMAKMRIRLRQESDKDLILDEMEEKALLHRGEVDFHRIQLEVDRQEAEKGHRNSVSQVQYLQSLDEKRKDPTQEAEVCPICLEPIGPRFSVLPCGHQFCEGCLRDLLKKRHSARHQTTQCPSCKVRHNISEISYILERTEAGEAPPEPVKGSYGTKIETVVGHILALRKREDSVKILVFSEWNDVLKIVGDALAENSVKFIRIDGKNHFEKKLEEFKQRDHTVLLLPLKTCANGLNLIEATAVMSVEPSLNGGAEQQAFNRVHRIGQTRPTQVFRFITKDTIEEKIYDMCGRREYRRDHRMSVKDVRTLIEGETESSLDASMTAEEETEWTRSEYWKGRVFFQKREWTRAEAVERLVRNDALDRRERGVEGVTYVEWMGREVPEAVIEELQSLPPVPLGVQKKAEDRWAQLGRDNERYDTFSSLRASNSVCTLVLVCASRHSTTKPTFDNRSTRSSANSFVSHSDRRRLVSVRCMSILVSVASVLVASAIIGGIGAVRQQQLQDSWETSSYDRVVQTIQLQVEDLLSGPDTALTKMETYFRRTNITFNTDGTQIIRDVYLDNMYYMMSLCGNQPAGCVTMFYWPNGKCFGAESYHGVMDIYENTVYNSSYVPIDQWYIDPNGDVTETVTKPVDFTYQYSADVNLNPGQGGNCSSPRWWSELQYFPSYDPPIIIVCVNKVYCKNGTQLGFLLACVEITSLQETLRTVLEGFEENSLIYLVEQNSGRLIATSTDLFPYDITTDTPITASSTNLTWIYDSFYHDPPFDDDFTMTSGGVDYLGTVDYNIAHFPGLNWTVFVLSVKPVNDFARNAALIALATCIGATMLVFVTTYLVTRSLFLLSNELEKVSRLELDLNNLSEPPIWEAQRLYRSFIMMHAALSSFRKFVPIELISHIMKSRREAFPYLYPTKATIYFQDIKDFTKLAEVEDPEVLGAVTEEYMEAMTAIIIDNGGMVDKYIGDCIMALFNLPSPQAGHEQAAVRSALECTEQLKILNKRWKKLYNIELQHRIGINTGDVLAGNIGSSQRLAFTCIGDNVNLASRVEAANKHYSTAILITDSTYDKIDKDVFQTRKISTVRVAGKKRETVMYEVSGDKTQTRREMCQTYEYALQLYDTRQLYGAKTEVECLMDLHHYDAASRRLRDRVMAALTDESAWSIVEISLKHTAVLSAAFFVFYWKELRLWKVEVTFETESQRLEMTETRVVELKPVVETRSARSSANSFASTGDRRPVRRFLRRLISVRCISILVAVVSVLIASTVIGSIGVVRQQQLQDSFGASTFFQVVKSVETQVANLLIGPDLALTKMTIYFQRTNITFNTGGTEVVRDVYRENMYYMMSLCGNQPWGCEMMFYWDNGKSFGAESYHGVMDVFENFIYNSTYTPCNQWYIDPDGDVSETLTRPADFSYQYSATINKKGHEGNNCSSPRWWSDLQYYPEYDPPNSIICENSVYCKNGTKIGYLFACMEITSIHQTLKDVLKGFEEESLLYIIEDTSGTLVATSTGLFPYDLVTNTPITATSTNLTWISDSYQHHLITDSIYFSITSRGVDYQVSVQHNIAPLPGLDWTLFVLTVKPVNDFARNAAVIALATCIGAALLVFVATYLITRSLVLLSSELEKVSRLELNLINLSEPPIWEAQRLYRSFIMMHAALSSFRKFVPIELISHIMKSRREAFPYLYPTKATIYFQDIKDFTRLAETEDPEVLAAIAEEYMEAMTTIIIDNGGMVDKYIGDCIMALFNLPSPQDSHEHAATRSAVECTEQLKILNKRWKKLYNIELQHRIGINTGDVLAGNIGSSQRLAFTCIGDNVNLASRVEAANKHYSTAILITDSTYDKIDKDVFQTRKIGTVRVAGKKRETVLYEVSGDKTQTRREMCQTYEYALRLYDTRQLHAAMAEVECLVDLYGYDAASRRLRDRVMAALEDEAAWGIVELLDK